MQLHNYSRVNKQILQKVVNYTKTLTDAPNFTIASIEEDFTKAYNTHCIYVFKNADSAISYFKSSLVDKKGNPIWYTMVKNQVENSMQDWYGLFVVSESELLTKLLSFNHFFMASLLFNSPTEMNNFLKHLAEKAMPENWNYRDYKSSISYPILKSYIENTYIKLLSEQIKYDAHSQSESEKSPIIVFNNKIYFNSGLLDRYFNQIIITADVETEELNFPGFQGKIYQWGKNVKCYSHNEYEISKDFNEQDLPPLAKYFTDPSEITFNADLQINLNDDHVFIDGLERGRILKYKEQYHKCKDDVEKKNLISSVVKEFNYAVAHAQRMAQRNYRLAVPQYWHENEEIQFLLPIYLGTQISDSNIPQCVLALKYVNDGRIPNYRGATVLTLDMAYQNARLIARPDSYWLKAIMSET